MKGSGGEIKSSGEVGTKNTPGASSISINQPDASRLVGGIVEKGFSDQPPPPTVPFSAPQPSVLPFPVARHRSHGPHWAPVAAGINGTFGAENDENGGDEEDFSVFDSVMGSAKPLQRKEKKSLDFSRWRGIMDRGDSSSTVLHKQAEHKHVKSKKQHKVGMVTEVSNGLHKPIVGSGEEHSCRIPSDAEKHLGVEDKYSAVNERVKEQDQEQGISYMAMDIEHAPPSQEIGGSNDVIIERKEEVTTLRTLETNNKMQVDTEMQNMSTNSKASVFGSSKLDGENGEMSLQCQIDAENRARLGKMSADEIAEAQAQIMEKMNPALLDALRKRGLQKLKRKQISGSDMAVDNESRNLQEPSNLINASTLPNNASFQRVMEEDAKDKARDFNNNDAPSVTSKRASLWDSWSKRVEDVRNLRFSLDGNIIKSNFAVADNGSIPMQTGYNAGNVSERDFLRTEGDPAAGGYTIKEAVALTRSVVPGQRSLALHLLATILDRAIACIVQNKVRHASKFDETGGVGDWEAIWAFALGPEPELALTLRICLDDNHNSVVLACAKVIQSVLSCNINESIFETSEKISTIRDDVSTAPVFRTKSEIEVGFLHGGFWKYNAKPSNILSFADDVDDKPDEEPTIQDDVVVAGQDVAAGLVRMGSLPRIQYLFETEPSAALEESLLSIIIAVAMHSPTCATAVMTCERLVQTVIERFIKKEQMEINPSKIKSITLLKVLARIDKKNCVEFIKSGIVPKVTWHLCRYSSFDQWMKSGREACKLASTLLVEQLRLLKVCIRYGYCVTFSVDLLPALIIWLNFPPFEKLVENNILSEFAAITKEAYLVLGALTERLPNFYKPMRHRYTTGEEMETWSWNHVGPLVDLALEWTMVRNIGPLSRFLDLQKGENRYDMLQNSTIKSLLWVVSSAMYMLSGVLGAVIPLDTMELEGGYVPWLPEFVPKIGIQLIKSRYFCFSEVDVPLSDNDLAGGGSFVEFLCHLKCNYGDETSMASASCLQGLLQTVTLVDKLIQLAKPSTDNSLKQYQSSSREDKILANGIIQSSLGELETLLTTHMEFASNWHHTKPVEMFGRGGPAPGIGVGWGASGGGFWSNAILLPQVDARLVTCLIEILLNYFVEVPFEVDQRNISMQMINSALEVCLISGPRDRSVINKIFDLLFQVPVLKCLEFCIHQFINLDGRFKAFGWKYEEEEYRLFCALLASHFKSRWLPIKKKSKVKGENQPFSQNASKKRNIPLGTIYEEAVASNVDHEGVTSLAKEWAYQRLPLPNHWFLSPISVTHYRKKANAPSKSIRVSSEREQASLIEVAQAGLFFLLGLEAMSALLHDGSQSSVRDVPVVWKLHALSVLLVDGMGVLENEKSRDVYGALQSMCGQLIDKSMSDRGEQVAFESLKFQTEVHENYSSFVEVLVDQFAAVSYGDLIFGRQIALYLHQGTEASVRLAAWNSLSNVRALELLPPLDNCIARSDGYLEPIEDNEGILEAYVKSWVSGALDKAANRRSASYTLALHHVASFIFETCNADKLSLRNQLVKSLLRDYSRKRHHEGMMINLLQYKRPATCTKLGVADSSSSGISQLEKRLRMLKEACNGDLSLLKEVEKLEQCVRKE